MTFNFIFRHKVKGHIYQDIPLTESIYAIKYRFARKSRKSGFLSSWVHLQACFYVICVFVDFLSNWVQQDNQEVRTGRCFVLTKYEPLGLHGGRICAGP